MGKSSRLASVSQTTAAAVPGAAGELPAFSDLSASQAFTKGTPEQRRRVIESLVRMPALELLPLLESLLEKGAHFVDEVVSVLKARPDDGEFMPVWQRLAGIDDRDTRLYVLEEISDLEEQRAARLLRIWLTDDDALLRRRALVRLAAMGEQNATSAAIKSSRDSDDGVRLQAAKILGALDTPAALPALRSLARDANSDCRSAALEALQQQAPFDALLAATTVQQKFPDNSLDALIVLRQYRPAELSKTVIAGVEAAAAAEQTIDADELAMLLLHMDDAPLERLLQTSPTLWLRQALVKRDTIAEPGAERVVARLISACSDPEPLVRSAATDGIARHDEAAHGGCLHKLLTHTLPEVRKRAVELLGRQGSPAVPLLRRTLRDADPHVRRATYEALAEHFAEDPHETWGKLLRDRDATLRAFAVERIIALPPRGRSRDLLIKAARDEVPAVRRSAICTLAERGVFSREAAAAYVKTLLELLAVDTTPLQKATNISQLVQAVKELHPTGAIEALLAAARYRKSSVVRREAAEALLSKGKKIALASMSELTDTEDPDVLRRVATTLATAKDPRALMPLLRAHDECPNFSQTAQDFLEDYPQVRQLKFLLKALKFPFPSVKRYAARQLIELDSPDMIEPLLLATKDPDPDVQRAAIQALAKYSKRPEVYQRLLEIRDQGASADTDVRQQAVAMLLGMDSSSIVGPLIQASREDDMEVQLAAVKALGKYATRPEVYTRLMEMVEFSDIAVREKAVETLGEFQVKEAVPALIRFLTNPFLRFRVEEALMRIGDRRGYLAVKRKKIRDKLFGKKKSKGPIAPPLRKGKLNAPARKH